MKRKFVNQVEDSNKFWEIEQDGNTYTTEWGKVGAKGRTNKNEFITIEDCSNEVNKLIHEKLKKGYIEIFDDSEILEKPL